MITSNLAIAVRVRIRVNTDPQRRCYDGVNAREEFTWSAWSVLESMKFLKPGTDPEQRLKFWRELNDYAVAARGESARAEYKIVEDP